MLVHIPSAADIRHIFLQSFQIRPAVYGLQGPGIHRLDTDLKLRQPGPEPPKQCRLLLPENIRGNLEMKICDTIVMFINILPYFHGMFMAAVKCPVHKFYLPYFVIQKKLQFPFYHTDIAEPDLLFHGRQTITAVKGTSPAALIVNDSVFKRFQVIIQKRDFAEICQLTAASVS